VVASRIIVLIKRWEGGRTGEVCKEKEKPQTRLTGLRGKLLRGQDLMAWHHGQTCRAIKCLSGVEEVRGGS